MMGKTLLGIAISAAALAAVVPLHGQSASRQHERIRGRDAAAGRIIVKFRPSVTKAEIAQIEQALDADLDRGISGIRARVVHSRNRHAADLEAVLAALPQVESVAPDWVVHATATVPYDSSFPHQWA